MKVLQVDRGTGMFVFLLYGLNFEKTDMVTTCKTLKHGTIILLAIFLLFVRLVLVFKTHYSPFITHLVLTGI